MRIAIVDDIESERQQLKELIQVQLNACSLHANFFEYENGEAFLEVAKQEAFTLVFLDIYMTGETGVEIAKQLRAFDSNCVLIFTTTSTDHALEGYRVRALHYLVKPYSTEEFNTLFHEIIERLPISDRYIEVKIVGGIERLRFSEILYAEHYQHQIHITTVHGNTIVTRQTFSAFKKNLEDERFFSCNRGAIVNLEHATDFDGVAFVMKDGANISVSRDLIKTARFTFGDYLFKRGKY